MRFHNKLLENIRRENAKAEESINKENTGNSESILKAWGEDFYRCIQDIAEHPVVLRMKRYPHHGRTNCYRHCLHVAYYSYVWCRFLRLNSRSAARGGMLHDMFLYDWHTYAARTGNYFHGFTHPTCAYRHAKQCFKLNAVERDVILTHMWPVIFFRFPRTGEGWIASVADKYCSILETFTH